MKAVEAVRRRIRRGRVLRIAAVIVLGASVTLALGGGAWTAVWLLLFAAARPVAPAQAADRLDQVLDADGAVRTAWDHRDSARPMVQAHRKRIDARLNAEHVRQAAPPPHWAWALCLSALAWPALTVGTVVEPVGPAVLSAASAPASATAASAGSQAAPSKGASPQTRAPQAGATPSAPSAPPSATPKSGGGDGGAKAEIAGVGASVGDRLALPATAASVGVSAQTARGIWLSDASGMRLPNPPVRIALAPPAGRPDDDITDPARPYPRRYHALIARWFANR